MILGTHSLKDKHISLLHFLPLPPLHSLGISKRKLLKVDRSGNPVTSFPFRETQEHCLQFFSFYFYVAQLLIFNYLQHKS